MKEFNPEKEYKKLNRKFTKKHLLIITSVVLVLAVIGISFANYSVNPNSILIIDSKVGKFSTGDITISVLVDGVKKDTFPTQEEGKVYKGIDCDNGSTATFDELTWKLKLEASGPDVCTVKFGTPEGLENCIGKEAGTCLASLSSDKYGKDLVKDGTSDDNVRYIGATPNNYITFNGEIWRIIGLFNNMWECPEDIGDEKIDTNNYNSKCKQKTLLKIIRATSLDTYSWDSTDSKVNYGYGVNEWSTSAIQTALNTAYYNSIQGTCYMGAKKSSKACDFSQTSMKGLDETARNQVARVMWNTGTIDGTIHTYDNTNTKEMYTAERSTNTGKKCTHETYCNDVVTRTTKWIGKVGLMYPSDYGYATSGGNTYNRETCLNYQLYSWNESGYIADCAQSSWLFNSSQAQWTMTPASSSSGAYSVFHVNDSGYAGRNDARSAYGVRPVVYLKSDVQITGGKGTSEEPYTLT